MSAARSLRSAPAHPATADFDRSGYHVFEGGVDAADAAGLLHAIRQTRGFDSSLFLTEAAFDADPLYVGVNPRPGRNLLDTFDDYLGFVEKDPGVVDGLTAVLGEGYEMLNRKIVCGLSFGYADPAHPVNGFRTTRAAVADAVRWVES